MGLFDKLMKEGMKVINDVTSEENKEKASAIFGNLKEGLDDVIQQAKENGGGAGTSFDADRTAPVQDAMADAYKEDAADGRTCREKILQVLSDEFGQYSVREQVSPTEIGGTGRFMDYSIVVYDGDTPKLIMMLIGKTTTAHREYRWSREAAENRGYTFLNFVEHYPNTIEYITDRLHKYL